MHQQVCEGQIHLIIIFISLLLCQIPAGASLYQAYFTAMSLLSVGLVTMLPFSPLDDQTVRGLLNLRCYSSVVVRPLCSVLGLVLCVH